MARTISQIYNSMIAEKESFSSLTGLEVSPDDAQTMLTQLTTASKVGIWRLIFWVCAVAIWIHENLFDEFETEIQEMAESLIPGTVKWWVAEMKKFQSGYSLTYNELTKRYSYTTTDTDAQIIIQAAAVESNGVLLLKVAKSDGATGLEKLTVSEKASVQAYIDDIKPAGVVTSLISDDPDDLKMTLTVYIDNEVVYNDESNPADPLNGSLISDATVFPVEDAINDYIQELDFNGIFYIISLVDAIQSRPEVTNVIINTAYAKYGLLSYSDILATASQSYNSNAGYLAIDSSFPLSDTITYKDS